MTNTTKLHRLLLSLFTVAFIMLLSIPCYAAHSTNKAPQGHQIAWKDAPAYLQEQIKNVVLKCTTGTLTPDKARIFEYTAPDHLSHYVYDYTAWEKHPLIPNCQNSLPICGENGCLMFAYTQIQPDVFKQSLRTYILRLTTKNIMENDAQGHAVEIPGFEMEQSKHSCRLLNSEEQGCTLSFTWKNDKFTYFGLGSDEAVPHVEPHHEKLLSREPLSHE